MFNLRALRHTFLYILYLFLCFAIVDRIYAKYEKFPFQYTKVGLQKWKPVGFKISNIPGLIYEMVPNLKKKELFLETNSMAIRAKEYAIPKPANTFRILILGDSIAYGIELRPTVIFSTVLENKLNGYTNKIRYEVINASVPGYNTMQEYIALVNKYYIYKPDLVIVGFCCNDLSPTIVQEMDSHGMRYGYLKHKYNKMKNSFENVSAYEMLSISMPNLFYLPTFLHRRLMLISPMYRAVTIRLYDFLSTRNPYKYPYQGYLGIIRDQTEYAVKNLKIYCQNNGIDLIFVLWPFLVDSGIELDDYTSELNIGKKILENNSVTYIDLRPIFQSQVSTLTKLRLAKGDVGHLNVLGHRLTAEAIYDYLAEYFRNKYK